MPDKPTGRVVALIVLLIVVAAALRGYLPARDRAPHADGSGRAALVFIVVLLSASLALLAVSVIARLRDPRAMAPKAGDISGMLGTGRGRPSWRVLLIGLAVIFAWLLIAMLLARFSPPHGAGPAPRAPDTGAASHTAAPVPQHPPPHNDDGEMLGILLAATIPVMLLLVVATLIMSRRRYRAATPHILVDHDDAEYVPPSRPSESLVRAAELGLAEMADRSREPREAIIACYAAMERELANVPGAAPQDFDTPTEVLARAVERHALHIDNAVQLVNLFEEARFSPHVMNEGHRDVAVEVLRLVLAEIRSPA
ncbi:hypothetical protein AWC05_04440 [Mycobacterium florentinum]|uniref:Protein-glutamine gamma-glutamyltransferase-like C-terminal domain-containing protein n=1 Tax=Mycobacterium florentinum TaxID=292462 RepID=A0A1X1TTD1_MYCFL|nr:DUF4129 domain-containing protein [Mycobacterium florentinum]MCV7408270.1 DUF4129 domain-containing protein [Mycobacterium florentinum]ORV47844.1 hypothetical protein AWC05_04440 [Mycobacterium florentinum]